MRPLRIAIDVAQTCAERAGCAWYEAALAEAMPRISPQNEFLLYHHFGGWVNDSTERGARPQTANTTAPMSGWKGAKAREFWNAVAKGDRKLPGNPDIVHAGGFMCPDLRHTGAKQVFMVHDIAFWTHPEFATDANRMVCARGIFDALRFADGFVFNSEYSRTEFEKLFPGLLERTRRPHLVTLLGTRFAPARDLSPRRDDFWYVAGTVEPRKNYATLLDALEIYHRRSTAKRPLIVTGGKGWKSENLLARMREMESRGLLAYKGYVDETAMLDLYAHCFGFLFPSWYEGFGLPVLEAMSQGAPVISSNAASLPEVGGDAVDLISPDSAEAIADAMLRFEADEDHRTTLRRRAISRAATLGWESCAEKTLAFYDTLMRGDA